MRRKYRNLNTERIPGKSLKVADAIALMDLVTDWIEHSPSEFCITYIGSSSRNGGWRFEVTAIEVTPDELIYQGFVARNEKNSTELSPTEAKNAFYVARRHFQKINSDRGSG